MARLARVVAVGYPHHVTQRGNRRMQTFFCDEDYAEYRRLMAASCRAGGVEIWAYCLMPNHVHLIAVPSSEDALRVSIGRAHERYTRGINFRTGWRGHLWQGRFASFPMNERHLLAAARYIELNPVRAGLSATPEEYPWSSAAAHLRGVDDEMVVARPLLEIVPEWGEFLLTAEAEDDTRRLRGHERTGRPLGDTAFVQAIEAMVGRSLVRQKPGPKPRTAGDK